MSVALVLSAVVDVFSIVVSCSRRSTELLMPLTFLKENIRKVFGVIVVTESLESLESIDDTRVDDTTGSDGGISPNCSVADDDTRPESFRIGSTGMLVVVLLVACSGVVEE